MCQRIIARSSRGCSEQQIAPELTDIGVSATGRVAIFLGREQFSRLAELYTVSAFGVGMAAPAKTVCLALLFRRSLFQFCWRLQLAGSTHFQIMEPNYVIRSGQ